MRSILPPIGPVASAGLRLVRETPPRRPSIHTPSVGNESCLEDAPPLTRHVSSHRCLKPHRQLWLVSMWEAESSVELVRCHATCPLAAFSLTLGRPMDLYSAAVATTLAHCCFGLTHVN